MDKKYLFKLFEKILPYIVGGVFFYFLLIKKKVKRSENLKIDEVIDVLDSCFNKLYWFDSDLEPIFNMLEQLSHNEIVQLHKDFGKRYYNPLLGRYIVFQFVAGWGFSRPLSLSALMFKEFDEDQIIRVKSIYATKLLSFPV